MRTSPLFLASITLLAVIMVVTLAISAIGPSLNEEQIATSTKVTTPLTAPSIGFGNPQRGSTTPKLDLVVFGDYQCGPCRDLEPALTAVLQKYKEVRIVWKDFPNATLHPQAVLAAEAARCAAEQGAFWEYHDAIMLDGADINEANLLRRAEALNLDSLSFRSCLSTEATKPILERDFEEGQRLSIDATPYMFIGSRRVSGALSTQQLLDAVAAELAKLKTP